MSTCTDDSFINSKLLSNYFKDLCEKFSPPYKHDSVSVNKSRAEINGKITFFLSQIKRLISEGQCDALTFKNEIIKIKKLNVLHIEILWYLEVYDLIPLKDAIQYHEDDKNEEVIEHISSSLFQNILQCKPNQSNIRKKMIASYMKAIFNRTKDELQVENHKVSCRNTILNYISNNFREFYKFECQNSLCFEDHLNLTNVIEIFSEAKLDLSVLNFIFQNIIDLLLQGTPQTMKNVFKVQEKLKSDVKKEKIYLFFTAISNYCKLDELINQFKILLLENLKVINWNNALPFICFLGISYKDGWKKLKELSTLIVNQSFLKSDTKLLAFVFLIARQCCFEKVKHYFPSYLKWFSSTFCTKSATPIRSKETIIFFYNFLTDLIPIEPIIYLKVHINAIPSVPPDHQSIVSDYVTLAKTKLCDLNASTELGICENATEQSSASFDVENVLEHFKRTNSILGTVFQASMFSKNYFEKKFLVELLSKYEGENSPRHELIMKLHSLDKIPKSAFKKYKSMEKKNCESK